MQILKNPLGGLGFQGGMQTVTKESNFLTNVWNSFTEAGEDKGADLCNFENGWRLEGTACKRCFLVDKGVCYGTWVNSSEMTVHLHGEQGFLRTADVGSYAFSLLGWEVPDKEGEKARMSHVVMA